MSRPRLIALLLALITLVVFLPVGTFSFVNFDDDDYVTNNAMVQQGLTWAGVRWAFTTLHASNWHPLTWLSHMADCELFQLNAGAHHLVNVFFHAANVALLFWLIWRLTKQIWPATIIAALFAWHPLHVESVAWISERKDVLSTFFALLSLWCYSKNVMAGTGSGDHRPPPARNRFYWLALLFFALGLLAKPMLVTLPFVLLLLDFWPLNRFPHEVGQRAKLWPLISEKIPFFILTAISCVVTFLAQHRGEAVVPLKNVSLLHRLGNAPVAVAGYLQHFFWPSGLCAIYPLHGRIAAAKIVLSTLTLLAITGMAWRGRKTKPYFIIGWLWFLGTLIPVIGLVQVGSQAMADRYTYIPSIGLFIALIFLAREIALAIALPKILAAGSVLLISAACILATERQLPSWRNGETLFRQAIAVTQNNFTALVNLGVALDAQGRFPEALEAYREAEKIDASYYQVHNNLGNSLQRLGQHSAALAEYQKAIELKPDLAYLHTGAGKELAALGRWAAASAAFSEAIRLNPSDATPHLETGKVFFQTGREPEGVGEFRTALRLDPDNYETLASVAHYLAACENAAVRDGPNAVQLALKANEISGRRQPMVFDILGMALASAGDFTNAQVCAQNALNLAAAAQLKNTGQIQERLELYKKNRPWRESFRDTNVVANP